MTTAFDFEDGNGSVPARKHLNPDGTEGGWVAETAQVGPSALVAPDARVYGKAWVSGDAVVFGEAEIYGKARVRGNAWVYDRAQVSGSAVVFDHARVFGNAAVSGNAQVFQFARVSGDATVSGSARVGSDTIVWGDDKVFGETTDWKSGCMQEVGAMGEKTEKEFTKEAGEEFRTLLKEVLCKTGRMTIGYAVANYICRHALGSGIDDLMPAGAWGTFAALFVTDVGLMKAVDAVTRRMTGNPDPKLVKNQAKAEFINGGMKGGMWIVSGIEVHGMGTVTVMSPKEFHRFEARIAKDGAILTKTVPGADGVVTTMSYASGKLHKVGAPAVVRTKDGEVVEELWFEGGRQVKAPAPAARNEAMTGLRPFASCIAHAL